MSEHLCHIRTSPQGLVQKVALLIVPRALQFEHANKTRSVLEGAPRRGKRVLAVVESEGVPHVG